MSASPDAISALLAQYGLMGGTPQQPAPQGGLMGALNAAFAPYGGATQAGLAMMANQSGATNPMAALSQGLMNSQQISLKNQQQQLANATLAQEIAQRQLQMPYLQARMQAIQEEIRRSAFNQGQPGAAGDETGNAAASPSPAQPPAPSSPYTPVTQADIARTPVPGVMSLIDQELLAGPNANWGQIQSQYRTQQEAVQKQQHAAAVARLDGLIASDHPAQYASSDQGFMSLWPALARQMNLDPRADFTDSNVRRALGMVRNPLAASVGMTTMSVPEVPQNIAGPYGSLYQVAQGGTKPGTVTEVTGQKPPAYTAEKVFNPDTGKYEDRLVQTSIGGATPPIGANAPLPRGRGSQGTLPSGTGKLGGTAAVVDLGLPAPSAENNKAAMFAGEMRAGLQTMQRMESAGFRLSPTARTIAISMATDENPGMIRQLISQEVAARRLSPQEQTYLTSMMPLLQAAGHDQSGARLTTAQIRQNVESLLPLGASRENLAQVQRNRQGFYQGLLTQAGPAVQLPQYRNTLWRDLQTAQGVRKTINGKEYFKQGGKWYAE